MKDKRGSRGTTIFCFNLGTPGGGRSLPFPGCFTTQEGHPISTVQEAGWAPGLVWTDAKYLTPPRFNPHSI